MASVLSDIENDDRLKPGSNFPPDPIEELRAKLAETHAPLAARQAELLDMEGRLPASCDDVETAHKLADAIKVCASFEKNNEAARVAAKEPFLASERAVDAFFKNMKTPVEKLKAKIGAMLTTYQRKVEAEERARRKAEEDRLRAEAAEAERLRREAAAAARRAEEEASKAANEQAARDAKAAAAAAKEAADRAAQAAREKPAELTRERTDLGAVASLKRTWDFEVVADDLVPRMFLTVDHAAIRAYIKSMTDKKTGQCRAKIDGVRIFEKHDTVVR